MSIVSDSQVQFNGCTGTLHIENSAGSVVGVKHDGVVEVTTHGAQVALGQIQGQLRIAGDGLDVKLQQIRASVGVLTRSSNVTVELASEAVTVENDGGDVTIKNADGQIDLKARGGRVQIAKARGPVTVQADNEEVDVEWDVLPSAADSKITNEGGSVTVRFPPAGDTRIDATSRNGRIENALAKVVVDPDGGAAQGVANGGGSDLKTVTILASGDVRLLGTDAPAAEDTSGQAP
jgi:hypothetical protein